MHICIYTVLVKITREEACASHIHAHTRTYTHIHAHTRTYTHIHAHTRTYTHIHAHTRTYTHIHAHTHMYSPGKDYKGGGVRFAAADENWSNGMTFAKGHALVFGSQTLHASVPVKSGVCVCV